MSEPTLHRLLWGTPGEDELQQWNLTPWETPALGLPSRVGATLLRCVGVPKPHPGWSTDQGPLTWRIEDADGVLARGRSAQFDGRTLAEEVVGSVGIARSEDWEVLPHAAYYLPFVSVGAGRIHPESYVLYCDALLFLTALDGDERILDGLVRWGVRDTPFIDRWSWRSRVHLPLDAWVALDKVLRWAEKPSTNATPFGSDLLSALEDWSEQMVSGLDFMAERIDVGLAARQDLEIVRTIQPAGESGDPQLPPELRIADASIVKDLVVRIGQIDAWPSGEDALNQFPEVSLRDAHLMIEQVANAFGAPSQSSDGARPDLVILPELAVPRQEVESLRNLVRDTGTGAVAGLYWRALHPPYRAAGGVAARWRCFVNEAELILPTGEDERGPPSIRWFRVRKPVPAHIEDGLARALTKKGAPIKWRMLRGKRWYRFVDPRWGDFTIAICADLVDAAPWRALRGELLHLLMVAFNKDVNLFESLTWVRAYENYVNVVSVNHGHYGGSFIWTPRTRHGRELANLRGGDLVVTADVRLPVKDLLRAQRKGVKAAIKESARDWLRKESPVRKFKAPPPGFKGRV